MFFSKYQKMLSGNNNSHCIKRIHVNNLPHITIDDKFNVKCMIPKTDADRTMSYSVHTTLLHQTPNTEIKYYIYIVRLHSYSESQYPHQRERVTESRHCHKSLAYRLFSSKCLQKLYQPPQNYDFYIILYFNTIRY